jgi:hypothetical protein
LVEQPSGPVEEKPESEQRGQPLVLVVDDDPKPCELLRFSLSRVGFRVEKVKV